MTTEPKQRKPRRKNTTDLGKRIMQRERQQLAREQARLADEMAEAARQSRRTQQAEGTDPVKRQDTAVSRTIVKRIAGVLSSENVNVSIATQVVAANRPLEAWTDFSHIHVGYHLHEDIRLTAAVLRGLLYHEGGHVRWTVPFVDLREMYKAETGVDAPMPYGTQEMHFAWNALEDQRMETAVTVDSPRKAGYFAPTILSELAEDVNKACANWPLMVGRRYLSSKVRDGARKLFVVRHGADGERFAQDIEAIVDRYITATTAVTMWQAVIDMADMFTKIFPPTVALDDYSMGHAKHGKKLRKPDPDALQIPMPPQPKGEPVDVGDEDPEFDLTNPVIAGHLAEILSKMMLEPETLLNIQFVTPSPSEDEQEGQQGQGQSTPKPQPPKDDPSDGEAEGQGADDDSSKGDDSSKDEEGDDEGGSKDADEEDADEKEGQAGGRQGGAEGTHTDDGSDLTDDDLTNEALEDAIDEAEQRMLADKVLDGDVEAFHDSLDSAASMFEPYVGGVSNDALALAEALNLGQEIENAFRACTTSLQPDWYEQQRRGIVNPLRYRTRRPGEHDFFKAWVENGNPGFDLSVSLLLDYSGSMGSSTGALAKVALASKAACQNLGVPCTVLLWDTSARVLFDANEQVNHLPIIQGRGGTNPYVALSDLDNQRQGKAKHIVIVMTDGQWSGGLTMASYAQEGRVTIGLGYSAGSNVASIRDSMEGKGFDESYAISDLAMIPVHLERALIEHAR